MLSRLGVAAAMVAWAALATTGTAFAASHQSDREEVAIGTFLVAVGVMALLLIFYLIKHALGLDRMPPPSPESDHGAHH